MKRYFAAALALFALNALALEQITLAIPTSVGSQYADLLYGKELGFFSEEGIDLQLTGFTGGTAVVVPQVANKSVAFGLGESSLLIANVAKKTPLPVRYVYSYLASTTYDYAVRPDSPVKSLADLKGKKIGVVSMAAGNIMMTRAQFKQLGLNIPGDVTLVPVGSGPAAWRQLQEGKVDALNLWFSEDARMVLGGVPIRRISHSDNLRPIFSSGMMAHVDTIRDKPQLVAGMGRAMAKSSVACAAAREKCVRAYWRFDPTSKPTAEKEAEWVRGAVAVLDANYGAIEYALQRNPSWGAFDPKVVETYVKVLEDGGTVPAGAVAPASEIFTNSFVPEFNKFDRLVVQRQSR